MRKSEPNAEAPNESNRTTRPREYDDARAAVLRSLHAPRTHHRCNITLGKRRKTIHQPPFSARVRRLRAPPAERSREPLPHIVHTTTYHKKVFNTRRTPHTYITFKITIKSPRAHPSPAIRIAFRRRRSVVVRTPRRASRRATHARTSVKSSFVSIPYASPRDRVGARRNGHGTVSRGRGLLFEIWDRSTFVRVRAFVRSVIRARRSSRRDRRSTPDASRSSGREARRGDAREGDLSRRLV